MSLQDAQFNTKRWSGGARVTNYALYPDLICASDLCIDSSVNSWPQGVNLGPQGVNSGRWCYFIIHVVFTKAILIRYDKIRINKIRIAVIYLVRIACYVSCYV